MHTFLIHEMDDPVLHLVFLSRDRVSWRRGTSHVREIQEAERLVPLRACRHRVRRHAGIVWMLWRVVILQPSRLYAARGMLHRRRCASLLDSSVTSRTVLCSSLLG